MRTTVIEANALISSPVEEIWLILTNINLLTTISSHIKQAAGTMDEVGAVRVLEIHSRGHVGTFIEKCILFDPLKSIGWRLENETLGLSSIINDFTFSWQLTNRNGNTLLSCQSSYKTISFAAWIQNYFIIRRSFRKAFHEMLRNIEEYSKQLPHTAK